MSAYPKTVALCAPEDIRPGHRKGIPGTIYLIHFMTPYKHARHYLGWTAGDLTARLGDHRVGQGSRLMEVIVTAGVDWKLVRTWENVTRYEERRLKGHSSTRYCPVCTPGLHGRQPGRAGKER